MLLLYSYHEALSSSSLYMCGQDGLSLNLDGWVVPVGGDRPAHCPASAQYNMQLVTTSSNSLVNDLRMFFFFKSPPKSLPQCQECIV